MSQVLAATKKQCLSRLNIFELGILTGPMARIQQCWFPPLMMGSQEQKEEWDKSQYPSLVFIVHILSHPGDVISWGYYYYYGVLSW